MRRIISFILSAALIAAVPAAASAYSVDDVKVKFFVRLDGTKVDSNGNVASQSTSNYTKQVASGTLNATHDSSFNVAIGGDVTEEDLLACLTEEPSDADILAAIAEQKMNEGYLKDEDGNVVPWSKLSTENYAIDWYVLKYERGDNWHVDGNLVDVATDEVVQIYTPSSKSDIPIDAYAPDYDDPVELESDYAYIFGRTDTSMKPEENMRRGEAAAVIYRLLKQNDALESFVYSADDAPIFTDTAGRWDRSALEYMYDIGVYEYSGIIGPDQDITRGEAFKMLAIALGFTDDTTLQTEQYAAILVNKGYVDGYGDDGSVLTVADLKLDNDITRAEFCKIYNLIIERTGNVSLETADGEEITGETYGFTDLDSDEWYYEDMLMATSAFTDGYVDIAARGVRNVLDDYTE